MALHATRTQRATLFPTTRPSSAAHECDEGRALATSFERMWPTVLGCSEPLRTYHTTWSAGRHKLFEDCNGYANDSFRCLVHGEVTCLGCREWHRG